MLNKVDKDLNRTIEANEFVDLELMGIMVQGDKDEEFRQRREWKERHFCIVKRVCQW